MKLNALEKDHHDAKYSDVAKMELIIDYLDLCGTSTPKWLWPVLSVVLIFYPAIVFIRGLRDTYSKRAQI